MAEPRESEQVQLPTSLEEDRGDWSACEDKNFTLSVRTDESFSFKL
jgi:hypothetical protein